MRPDAEEVSAGVFATLADPNRRASLASLAEHGPSTAQSYLAALAADWDGSLKRLSAFLADPPR